MPGEVSLERADEEPHNDDLRLRCSVRRVASAAIRRRSRRSASTVLIGIPTQVPNGLEVHFAGVSWDLVSGEVVSIAETRSFVTE